MRGLGLYCGIVPGAPACPRSVLSIALYSHVVLTAMHQSTSLCEPGSLGTSCRSIATQQPFLLLRLGTAIPTSPAASWFRPLPVHRTSSTSICSVWDAWPQDAAEIIGFGVGWLRG